MDSKNHALSTNAMKEYVLSMIGGILYAAGLNLFVVPLGLYIGAVAGIAQMLGSIINSISGLNLQITGELLLLINIPLLFMTYKAIDRGFFKKTLVTAVAQSLALSILPVPAGPLINDWLILCLIGGVLSGFGAGLSLRYGGSGGGLDVLGVWMSLKYRDFSVGRVSLLISSIVMIYVAFTFTLEILIYSILFTLIYSLVLDQVHYQNVKVSVLIVTENSQVGPMINETIGRKVAAWEALGVCSNEKKTVILAVMDKYEFRNLKTRLLAMDQNLFMIDAERIGFTGTFDKHLFS